MAIMPVRIANLMTPARVRSLCRLSCDYHLNKKTLAKLFQPEDLNRDTSIFDGVYQCATYLELIFEDKNGFIQCKLRKESVEDTILFRRAIINEIMKDPEQIFIRFTAWYLQRGEKTYKDSSKDLEKAFFEEVKIDEKNKYNDVNITAWKTWASFLGYGFVHDGIMIMNVSVRLADILMKQQNLITDREIGFSSFMDWLTTQGPEMDYGKIALQNRGNGGFAEHVLSPGLSAGLRDLHDRKEIQLINLNDATDLWFLQTSFSHDIVDRISHIRISGGKG